MENRSMLFLALFASALLLNNAASQPSGDSSMQISGSSIEDAVKAYEAQPENQRNTETIITSSENAKTFYFGTSGDDSIEINESSMYAKGQNGADTYKLTASSPEYIWIDNQASDSSVDVFEIPSEVCESLKVQKPFKDEHLKMGTELDVILTCDKYEKGPSINIVLINYLKDESYKHIKISWNDHYFMILPNGWVFSGAQEPKSFMIAKIIDMNSAEKATISASPISSFWILHVPELSTHFNLEKDESHLSVSAKSTNSSVQLLNFFDEDGDVTNQWQQKFFFISEDLKSDSLPKIINGVQIEKFYLKSNEESVK